MTHYSNTGSEGTAQVLPFPPTAQTVSAEARRVVFHLAKAGLVTRTEAVRSLESMGATADEIEAVIAISRARRGRI